jgi:asparagine synthase (glutamine-hydrolysing)
MCGFVAGNIFKDTKHFHAALSLIAHRGRDYKGVNYSIKTNTYLGHNRLSIQGLTEEANQPMIKDDYILVYNGELWHSMNPHKEKFELHTGSDTELLLNMFHLDQTDCIKTLDGMFGFAILDDKKQYLTFARDFMGRIPLYFFKKGKEIVVASELKAITNSLNINASDVILADPGCYYQFDYKTGELEKTKFYEFPAITDIEDMEEEEVIDGIRDLLTEGVHNELISDVPVCTILSGGVDSTIITYLLKQEIPDLQAFVVSVGDTGKKDDLYYARMAAKEIGVPLHEVIIDEEWVEQNLAEAVYAVEDFTWTQVSPAVAQLALSKRIHDEGFKVVFGGEGSDELFASYGHVFAWNYKDNDYIKERYKLVVNLHKNNLIRTNKAMMYGGTVELRTPFLHKDLVEFCLRIPPKYKEDGPMWKPMLRKAFAGKLSDELLFRPKKTFQDGCHTIYLKNHKERIKESYLSHYGQRNPLENFLNS